MHKTAPKTAYEALRALSRKREPRERCELCGLDVAPGHAHLLDRESREIICACSACAILFSHRQQQSKFLRIPTEIRRFDDFHLTDAEWNALRIPIDMAFFVNNSSAGRVIAYYPSPAGCTESLLSLESWSEIAAHNASLDSMEADVEALLVNRTRRQREYYMAPLDQCYKLTGLIRTHWRGLSGGDEVWKRIDEFFSELRERAAPVRERAHA